MSQPPKRPGPPGAPPSHEPPTTTSSFAVEEPSSVSEMPSVTRLLNRARFGFERTQTQTQKPELPPLLKTEELLPPVAPPKPPTPVSLKKSTPPLPSRPVPLSAPSDAPTLEVIHTPESDLAATPSNIQINDISLATDTRFLATGANAAPESAGAEAVPLEAAPLEIGISLTESSSSESVLTTPLESTSSSEPSEGISLALADPPPGENTATTQPIFSSSASPASEGSTSRILSSAQGLRRHQGFEPARLWLFDELKFGTDPLGKGMAGIHESGKARGMSFLQARPGSQRPIFESFGFSGVDASRYAWMSGMVWDSLAVPDLWSTFLKAGVLELSPPPSGPQKVTPQSQARALARKLFGVSVDETLTLIRVGTKTQLRGVLVILSKGSVQEEVNAAMLEFQSAGPEQSQLFSIDSANETTPDASSAEPPSGQSDRTGEIRIEFAA